ncbi:MipA/OmpV family protein [Neorhizobium sp. T786]|uniref:MipA/OmpV family protein n=1 Tax=Pseudorhizobium xiangyangii TaxID=2883104 RepID=UPI001CFFCAAF|nr:MipA/OmpV family protein [Neorhizobium xiangyangii]MCB5205482.1 MipA/OmpV family protein [Neorhizobium xiangyangii]
MRIKIAFLLSQGVLLAAGAVSAQEDWYPWDGDWYLKVGGTGFVGPKFEGSSNQVFQAAPLVSLGKPGSAVRFSSRNDSMSYALFDEGSFRGGAAGKLIFKRDGETSEDLEGLDPIKFGGEVGGFAEAYPTEWMRVRAELRQGIRSHAGIVGNFDVDAFVDVSNKIRISGGPRLTAATKKYVNAYYGVDAVESAASGLDTYSAHGGLHSAGVGAAVNWQATEKLELGAYAEYRRLLGSAADSTLVRDRGSRNDLVVGLSATYRFDFTVP